MANRVGPTIDKNMFRIIAHRGLHDKEVCENSLKAFSLAIEAGVPFEFDFHLSKDGHLIVCHDAELERVCGKKGYIPDLTLEEIKRDYRLFDGQEIPTIEEVFALNSGKVPMVIEAKVDKGNWKALMDAAQPVLDKVEDKGRATLISFDPRALHRAKYFGFSRGFLLCKEYGFYKRLSGLFDYLDVEDSMVEDPYIAKYRQKGRLVNTWTIETKEQLGRVAPNVDMVTFQFLPIEEVKKSMEGGNHGE